MRKVIVIVLLSLLTLEIPSATPAEVPASIAVIDVGINSSLFKDVIATEVCVLSSYKCPNGKQFMEGPGAANIAITEPEAPRTEWYSFGNSNVVEITSPNPPARPPNR